MVTISLSTFTQTSVPEPTDEPTVEIIPTLKPTRKVRNNAVEFVIDCNETHYVSHLIHLYSLHGQLLEFHDEANQETIEKTDSNTSPTT